VSSCTVSPSSLPESTPEPLVQRLVDNHIDLWRRCDSAVPAHGKRYSPHDQHRRGRQMDRFLEMLDAELRCLPATRQSSEQKRDRIFDAFSRHAAPVLDLNREHLDLLRNGFVPFATEFCRAARRFDAAISASDICQATRNAWTAAGLRCLHGLDMRLTPAVTAYSLLYPYTDNYLDDLTVGPGCKQAFNRRLRLWLKGEPAPPATAREGKVYELVRLIEENVPRASAGDLYASLLAIHDAQSRSLRLRRERCPTDEEILAVTFEKGGTSVLADAYLAVGTLNPAQVEFAFGWGVFLQLVDDLQDLAEDGSAGIVTLFSHRDGRVPLDCLTNRLLRFGDAILTRLDGFRGERLDPLKHLIRDSAITLTTAAASAARDLYTPAYIADLERRSRFRFSYLDRSRASFFRPSGPRSRLVQLLTSCGVDDHGLSPL
jgi:hypothetical protein